MANELAPSLSVIYQASLEQGVLPQDWTNCANFQEGKSPSTIKL